MKRILIIYATAGTGHKKAAYALKAAFDRMSGSKADIIDCLDYTNAFFRWTYPRIYIFMVNRIPFLWGLSYYLMDNKILYRLASWIRHITNWFNARALAKFLVKEKYDCIITTHFMPPDVITMLGKNKVPAPLISVITDFRSHTFWIADGVDMYVVGQDETRKDLVSKYNIPQEKIKVLGIPIDPIFSEHKDKEALSRKLGIDSSLFTALVGSGGFGVGPIVELVKSFKGVSIPIQLIVVCGKNEELLNSVKRVINDLKVPVKAYGYINNMDEFMEVADIIITKTGGMMSSESLAKRLPIVGIAPIPGQETRNFNILVKSSLAIGAKNVKDVPKIVEKLYKDKNLRMNMIKKVESVRKPNAASDIARLALRIMEKTA